MHNLAKFHLGIFNKLEGKCKQECEFQVILPHNVLYKGTPDCPFAYIFIYRRPYKYPHTSFKVTVQCKKENTTRKKPQQQQNITCPLQTNKKNPQKPQGREINSMYLWNYSQFKTNVI